MAAPSLYLAPLVTTTTTTTRDGVALTTQNQSEHTTKRPSGIGLIRFCRNIKELNQLHAQFIKKGLNHSPSALSKLIAACAEMGSPESLEYARKAFELFEDDESSAVSLYMFNSLIRGYSIAGLGDESILLYARMVAEGVSPDHYTFPFVLSACAKIAAFFEGVQLHGSVVKMGLEEDVFIQTL